MLLPFCDLSTIALLAEYTRYWPSVSITVHFVSYEGRQSYFVEFIPINHFCLADGESILFVNLGLDLSLCCFYRKKLSSLRVHYVCLDIKKNFIGNLYLYIHPFILLWHVWKLSTVA